MASKQLLIPAERIEQAILLLRGEKVMLDRDLAELYAVETFNLNKAVKRNIDRFPPDFMFQLTKEEAERLRFQTGISKPGRGGRRYLPHVQVVMRHSTITLTIDTYGHLFPGQEADAVARFPAMMSDGP